MHIILGGDISGSDAYNYCLYIVGLRVLKVGRSESFEGQLLKVLKACSFCTDKNILLYCCGFTWVMISLISIKRFLLEIFLWRLVSVLF